ncbi:hypothetical protein OS493_038350 [Desmophyllum pertusum]|uniref:CUB domain-containing protein n=1 Tax=Desmophyllum pertusum TaxID=174260 RepID=A0A9W9YIZ6_9CNID|nr:hypothetical protein OS493_038350 [Desmophyllum pertusum]
MMMNISFIKFVLEDSDSCLRDYLKITNENDRSFGVYCGQKTGQTVLVTGKYASLKFHSDSNIQKRGFVMYVTAVPQIRAALQVSTAQVSTTLQVSTAQVPTTLQVAPVPATLKVTTVPATFQEITEITQRIKDDDDTINEPTQRKDEPTGEKVIVSKTMTYILSGVASIPFLLLCFIIGFWCYRRLYHKGVHRSSRPAREIIPFDKWELLPEQIEHEEELGRGAFGVVYKATLNRRVGIEVFDTKTRLEPNKACQVVAVKVLQGTSCKTMQLKSKYDRTRIALPLKVPSTVTFIINI